MNKELEKNYNQIISDLQPVFDKWGEKSIIGVIWNYRRREGRIKQLKLEQEKINNELKKYEKK